MFAAIITPGSMPALILVLATIAAALSGAIVVATAATPTERVQRRLQTLIRARTPVIWLAAAEEGPAARAVMQAAAAAGMRCRLADVADGIRDGFTGEVLRAEVRDTDGILTAAREATQRSVWILRDPHRDLGDGPGPQAVTVRLLKNLAEELTTSPPDRGRTVVLLTAETRVPNDLRSTVQYVEWPMPSAAEIGQIVRDAIDAILPRIEDPKIRARLENPAAIAAATAALTGLRHEEASQIVATTLAESLSLDPGVMGEAKRAKVESRPSLQFRRATPGGWANMAGNDRIVTWGTDAARAFTPDAAKFGVLPPRCLLLVGVAGCGKTLAADCLAGALGDWPLIEWTINADKGKYVGDSESGLRSTLSVLDAMGRCIILVDEVEKQISGDGGDGGVSQDYLGTLLRWMQNRTSEAILVLTANRVDRLPRELLRPGRVDAIFFVDLPTVRERGGIAAVALRKAKRNPEAFDLEAIARGTEAFSGAEVAQAVKNALAAAFKASKPDVETADVIAAATLIPPASVGAADAIKALREWCKANGAVPATTPEQSNATSAPRGRAIDL